MIPLKFYKNNFFIAALTSILAGGLFLSGCSPTYRKGEIPSTIVKICKEEYGLDVKAKFIGKTVGVYVPLENILSIAGTTLKQSTSDAIHHVILSTHRVCLSAEDPIDFYIVFLSDTKTGAEFTMTGYVQDIKRARLMDISRDEYYHRLIRDLRLNFKIIGDKEGRNFDIKDITMPEFLSKQISQRINTVFETDEYLKEHFKIKRVDLTFEDRIFSLTLDAVPSQYSHSKEMALTEMLEAVFKICATVIRGYRFEDFDAVHVFTKTPFYVMDITRDNLELFRRNELTISGLLQS